MATPMDEDNDIEEQRAQRRNPSATRYKGNHPIAAFFHVIFKLTALLIYYPVAWLVSSYQQILLIVIVLVLAADFWTNKNITGRVMVGLRWWNSVSEDGTNVWHFESLPDLSNIHTFDAAFFWLAMLINVPLWIILTLVCGFFGTDALQWLPVSILAIVLSCVNIYGYVRCRKDARKQITGFVAGTVLSAAQRNPEAVARTLWSTFGQSAGPTESPPPAKKPHSSAAASLFGGSSSASSRSDDLPSGDYSFAPPLGSMQLNDPAAKAATSL